MRDLLRDVVAWLSAVARRWLWLAGGAAATLAQWVWHPTTRALVPVAVACVVVAVFLTWRDEHAKVAAYDDSELKDLASSMVETYVTLAKSHSDEGPHALATLNLAALVSDALIRKTIQRMDQRIGRDPWEGWARFVENVDLVRFFTWTREHGGLNHPTTVQDVAQQVKAASGHRPR